MQTLYIQNPENQPKDKEPLTIYSQIGFNKNLEEKNNGIIMRVGRVQLIVNEEGKVKSVRPYRPIGFGREDEVINDTAGKRYRMGFGLLEEKEILKQEEPGEYPYTMTQFHLLKPTVRKAMSFIEATLEEKPIALEEKVIMGFRR